MKQELKILYEDSHIIVCFKPNGIAVQSRRPGQPDMEHMLLNHITASMSGSHSGKYTKPYLGVIHRLDQPVSGILVFAKTSKAAQNLNKQLTSNCFGKHYLALVDGTPAETQGTLVNYMIKDGRTNTSRICEKDTAGAKEARLSYRVLSDSRAAYHIFPQDITCENTSGSSPHTILEVSLDTGRHHQIRVQLAHMGCPIVGDTKYNPNADAAHNWQILRLCAYKLTFRHPATGKRMHFKLSNMNNTA